MMSVDFTVGSHAIGYPANCLSQHYGEHMPHVELTTAADNGNIIGIGDWKRMDVFAEAAPTTFTGKIVAKNVDGTYLVLVNSAVNAALVYQKPLSPYESPASLKDEHAFYNKAGDIVRTYVLHALDRIAVSAEGFSTTPSVGKSITGIAAKKLVVGA